MKKTVTCSEFVDAFKDCGRSEQFSREGLKSLFEHLKDIESLTGEEIELDVIDLCCGFVEYENLAEFREDYGDEYKTFGDIELRTTVIRIDTEKNEDGIEDGSFIVQQF